MTERQTLEEQVETVKAEDRRAYIEKTLKAMDNGRKVLKLYNKLECIPMFVERDIDRLFEKIMEDYNNKHFTTGAHIRKPENISAFLCLFVNNLVEIKEHRYLGIFKREVVVPTDITMFNN
ncbi:MAG TPA: hypothetical protein VMV95_03000 [Bacillota bacterium]|nr:hypothetical protein [Bacillota bacterium]